MPSHSGILYVDQHPGLLGLNITKSYRVHEKVEYGGLWWCKHLVPVAQLEIIEEILKHVDKTAVQRNQ